MPLKFFGIPPPSKVFEPVFEIPDDFKASAMQRLFYWLYLSI